MRVVARGFMHTVETLFTTFPGQGATLMLDYGENNVRTRQGIANPRYVAISNRPASPHHTPHCMYHPIPPHPTAPPCPTPPHPSPLHRQPSQHNPGRAFRDLKNRYLKKILCFFRKAVLEDALARGFMHTVESLRLSSPHSQARAPH